MDFFVVLGQMVCLFAMIVMGYVPRKIGMIGDKASKDISKLVIQVFNPCLMIDGILSQEERISSNLILESALVTVFYFALLIALGHVFKHILRPRPEDKSLMVMMTMFGNIGFMGIPVMRSIFGDGVMIYIVFYIILFNLILYTYGINLVVKASDEYHTVLGDIEPDARTKITVKQRLKMMANPGFIGCLVAIAIFVFDVHMPHWVCTFFSYTGNACVPLALMITGIALADDSLKVIFTEPRNYIFMLARFVALPIAMCLLYRILPIELNTVIFSIFIIQLGMPIGSNVTAFCKSYDANATYAAQATVFTTLSAIITIPIICIFI